MTKTYTITANDTTITYTVRGCTAIPVSIGETERVDALYVDYIAEDKEHVEYVVFGESMPETEEEFAALFDYMEEWDSTSDVLATVRFPEDEEPEEDDCTNDDSEIWEDGAGSLYWFILRDGKCIRAFEGMEAQGDSAIYEAQVQLATNPAAYKDWDGDAVERLRHDPLDPRPTLTAQELYSEITGDAESNLIYDDYRYHQSRERYWRLFAEPEALEIADRIQAAETWEACEKECERLCTIAGMDTEWRSANGETFEEVLGYAARKLHVRIG